MVDYAGQVNAVLLSGFTEGSMSGKKKACSRISMVKSGQFMVVDIDT
jgi:hypothetical protein